jgi:hypothetical protein
LEKLYPVLGHSMRFALEPGDNAAVEACAPPDLRAGELALLVKWKDGLPAGYVIHRVLFNFQAGGGRLLLTRGDANFLPDLPPSAFQPVGRVVALERGGRRRGAAPGPAWPLTAAYSFVSNKALSAAVRLVYSLFRAAAVCLPRGFSELLNSLYLFWEARLYPAALSIISAPARPRAFASGAVTGQVKSGRITSDETWAGKITVADYLIIEAGARVTAAPGCEITFTRREPWFFPVLRFGSAGTARELDSALAKALVYGEFFAAGTPDAPVLLGGDSFGGIHALGSGRVQVSHCLAANAGSWTFSVRDNALLDAENAVFSSCKRGVEAAGEGGAFLKRCAFSGLAGPAVRAVDGACLVFSRGSVKGAGAPAFELTDAARAVICGAAAADCVCAIDASGEAVVRAADCAASGSLRGAVLLGGAASLEASGCIFEGGALGLAADGRHEVSLKNCRISFNSGQAVSVAGRGALSVFGCELAGNGSGIMVSGGYRADILDSGFSKNSGRAVTLLGASNTSLQHCAFTENHAGISAKGRHLLALADCSFLGNSGPGVELSGHNTLTAAGCSFEGGESGIEGLGLNRVTLNVSAFSGIKGPGIELERAAALEAGSCVFSSGKAGILLKDCRSFTAADLRFIGNSGPAVCAEGEGKLFLERCSFTANRSGPDLYGATAASLRGCSFARQLEADLSFSGRASGSLDGCSFLGGGSALKLSGRAEAAAAGCVFADTAGAAVEVKGRAALRLEDSALSGANTALLLAGAGEAFLSGVSARGLLSPALSHESSALLDAAGCALSSGVDAVYCSGTGASRFGRCLLASDSGAALNLRSGSAELTACSLTGKGGLAAAAGTSVRAAAVNIAAADYGADCAGNLSASGLDLTGGTSGGIALSGPANKLVDVRVDGAPYPGIALAQGSCLAFDKVVFNGAKWAPLKPAARPARLKRVVFRFAAATSGWPVFSAIYRLIYKAALPAARLLLRGRGLRALYVYRGMADKNWVPGLSDLDLACVLSPAAPQDDFAAYSGLRNKFRLLKTIFPFAGELMLAQEKEFSGFMNCWGVKGREFPGASRLLSGRAVEILPAGEPGGLADATEAFYAYTLLMRHFFAEGLPEPFLRRNCLKNLLDIRRYLDACSSSRLSRAAYGETQGLPLGDFMRLDKGEAAFQAFRALHEAAPPAAAGAVGAPSCPPGGWFNRQAFEAACQSMAVKSKVDLGVALDSLYRVYLVLPDGAAADKAAYLRACRALREESAATPLLSASPLVLTARAFQLLCSLPYLNNPRLSADIRAGAGGERPDDGGVYCWNVRLPDGAEGGPRSREAAVHAARHFCASWRSLWGEMPPHYFYTRAAGLRLLLETGGSPDFSGPDRLRAALRAGTGAEAPEWKTYLAGAAGRANYEYISGQAAALGRLIDAG